MLRTLSSCWQSGVAAPNRSCLWSNNSSSHRAYTTQDPKLGWNFVASTDAALDFELKPSRR
jgi:hypothetical protein